jgi:hypothetical protein
VVLSFGQTVPVAPSEEGVPVLSSCCSLALQEKDLLGSHRAQGVGVEGGTGLRRGRKEGSQTLPCLGGVEVLHSWGHSGDSYCTHIQGSHPGSCHLANPESQLVKERSIVPGHFFPSFSTAPLPERV